jgi:hypothetical protein
MKAGVITVKGREKSLLNLRNLIEPNVDEFTVFIDVERRGQAWNLSRCMKEMIDSAKKDEPVLIMTDDVITVKDWRKRWEAIHKQANNTIYTFFSRQRVSFKPQNLARGYVTGYNRRGFYDQAVIYINQHGLTDRINEWFNNQGKISIKPTYRQKWYDVIIQEYLIENKIPWTLSTPTLFEHVGDKSTVGHSIGKSVQYVGAT